MEDAEYIHDKTNVFEIICAAPPEHLQQISKAYQEQYNITLEKAIEKGLGGKAKDGLGILVGMKLEPYETMAKLFKKACAGIGTNDFLLLTCVVRFQTVIKRVMAAHFDLFNKVCIVHKYCKLCIYYLLTHVLCFCFRRFMNEFAVNAVENS
jgi:hypothetical protein